MHNIKKKKKKKKTEEYEPSSGKLRYKKISIKTYAIRSVYMLSMIIFE